MQEDEELDYDDEYDEPMFWDVVEERYDRPLSEHEWRAEIRESYASEYLELTEDKMLEELQAQKDWLVLKGEIAARDAARKIETERPTIKAIEFWDMMMCPPIEDDDSVDEVKYESWVQSINEHIRTSIDMDAMIEVIRLHSESAVKVKAIRNALKRHTENHALRDEVYSWADTNIKQGKSLDDAASDIAGKVVPLKWRTVRGHLTKWKKLRSASTQ
jgi:hypothetical protein